MDQIFLELIGKPQLNPGKIITVVAENFRFLEEQAKFLKATLAIPAVKQLPLDSITKYFIQIGPAHSIIKDQLYKDNWTLNHYEQISESIISRMRDDISTTRRSIIFINDTSKLNLLSGSRIPKQDYLRLISDWKRLHNNFVVILHQNSEPPSSDKFLADVEYLSDAVIRTTTYKSCYLQAIWYQTLPSPRTLIPPRVETSYVTCKIGKSYWSSDLLCFFDRKEVPKDYDPDNDTQLISNDENEASEESGKQNDLRDPLGKADLESQDFDVSSTLPYTRAQDPEQSRIFYYPDKEDDLDEDDPDNDLGI